MSYPTRHPLNAKGDFFVAYDMCLFCDAPRSEAPELIDYDENGHCYFKRQPENPTELHQAIQAVRVSCIEAVRYGGSDLEILRAIARPFRQTADAPPSFWETLSDKALNFLRKLLQRS